MFRISPALTTGRKIIPIAAAIALSTLSSTGISQAAASRIPAAYYPVGARISYQPAISNHQMDCMWGFFCEGPVPLFHFFRQDQLHRLSGWGQFAGLRKHGRIVMSFELFVSHYQPGDDLDGTPFSKEAFNDLVHAVQSHGYTRLLQPRLLSAPAQGGSVAEIQRLGSSELIVIACWSGTQEIESIVLVDHGSASVRRAALHDLTGQVVRAIRGS